MTTPHLAPVSLNRLPDSPTVSVLVSNYNYAQYLDEAIDSVLSQTYERVELIICDDGSTDNSREIVARRARSDARVSLIAKENGGQGSGFNAAFAASSGDIICFLDSDDVFRPTKIACMVEAHQNAPDCGFGLHRVQRVSRRRRPRGVWPLGPRLPEGWHGEYMLQNGGILPYMPPTSGLTLRREIAERIFPLPEGYPLTNVADQVITRFAPLLTSVVRRKEALAEYRLHGANSYVRSGTSAASILREIMTCRGLWEAQRDFLNSIAPDLALQLQPVNSSPYLVYLDYVYARLSGSPAPWFSYHRFLSQLHASRGLTFWFWKYSIYLPVPLFYAAINLITRQSIVKELLARIRGLS